MAEGAARRTHRMPFGAQVESEGVRFRLWAPAAARVELVLEHGEEQSASPMQRRDGGWHEVLRRDASAGTAYRFRIDGGLLVPDPASRYQPDDVHAASRVVDPAAFAWDDASWRGRSWNETVLYELHVGSFSPEGDFEGVLRRLDHLARVGVTAVELMPIGDFPGARNWGYDGVLPFAPDAAYGTPDDLKRLVAAAHRRGLSVFCDVIYNHFGPEGNYLHAYARPFFNPAAKTPWGDAINFDREQSRTVRDFFIHNALYWLEEFHFDGLRLDAVHAIRDESSPSFLDELATAVHAGPGRSREIHLVLESVLNHARPLERGRAGAVQRYTAQWNDDAHHAFHCVLTGESEGYYVDFADDPQRHLARCLAEGFAYQGEPSTFRDGRGRGEPSRHLPPTAFVNFLQNHDQVGNRAFGERLTTLVPEAPLRAAVAVLLLAPAPPLLFMGEEFGSTTPFPFFCEFGPELACAVTEGRRREFARFAAFQDPAQRSRIPDPNAEATFEAARLDWTPTDRSRSWLAFYEELLGLRHREIVPRLRGIEGDTAHHRALSPTGLAVSWRLGDGSRLSLCANLGEAPLEAEAAQGRRLFALGDVREGGRVLGAWSVLWTLAGPQGSRA